MKIITLILTSIYIFSFISCKEKSTEPEQTTKSPREYTWTVDTIASPNSTQTLMTDIWGSAANDIYICGHNAGSGGNLWRYNGNQWYNINLFDFIEQSATRIGAVHGTSRENVWVAGSKDRRIQQKYVEQSLILQYDGIRWIEHDVKTNSQVFAIYVNSATDVWACGDNGIIYHYDGNVWDIDTLYTQQNTNELYQLNGLVLFNDKTYLFGANTENTRTKYVYSFFQKELNKDWLKIDSFEVEGSSTYSKWGTNGFYKSSFGKLYSYGYGGVFELNGNHWENIYSVDFSITGMADQDKSNILLCASFGHVIHFDGNNWKEIDKLYNTDILYTGNLYFSDQAFIVGYTLNGFPMKSIVLNGK